MKITISELWDTGRKILTYDNSEFDRPTSITDLKECKNVLLEKIGNNLYEILIENCIHVVTCCKLRHPSGGGSMHVIEVL